MGRSITLASAILLLACAACTPDDDNEDGSEAGEREWTAVHEALPGALLSVWTGDSALYTVGADGGDGPEVWSLKDGAWQKFDTAEEGDLWWVTEDPDGDVWMVGQDGLALRHDPETQTFERTDTATDATLWGIWFADSGRGWTVGGTIAPRSGVILTREGGSWVAETLPQEIQDLVDEKLLYKVWGTGEEDLWVVGEGGIALHKDGAGWQLVETPTSSRLFTVDGNSSGQVVMVGGAASPVLLEWDGGELVDHSADIPEGQGGGGLNGVFVSEDGHLQIVGSYGYLAERDPDGTWSSPDVLGTGHGLHAVRRDAEGGVWTVGGEITVTLTQGVMLHYGDAAPALP
jgi:hypothetical protein